MAAQIALEINASRKEGGAPMIMMTDSIKDDKIESQEMDRVEEVKPIESEEMVRCDEDASVEAELAAPEEQ